MIEREKLRILLTHWMEHNKEHGEEFNRWADRAEDLGDMDVASDLRASVQEMEQVNARLLAALDKLGGPVQPHH